MAPQPEKPLRNSDRPALIAWLVIVLAFSLPLYRPWLTLAATLVMILWLFGGDLRSQVARLRHHRLTLAILVFVSLSLASLAWSSDPNEGLRYVAKYRYLLLVPMLATAVSGRFRSRASIAFQIGAVASVAISLAVAFGSLRIGNAHPGNPSATMAHLDYTLVLAVASLLALTRVLYGTRQRSERMLWFAAFAMTALGLLVNIGRSGQLGFLAGLIVLLVRWAFDSSLRSSAATLAVALAAGLGIVVLAPPAVERMNDAREEVRAALVDHDFESNIGGRLAAVIVAGRIVRDEPLLGTGVGGNMPRFREVLDTELSEYKPGIYWFRHFHNQYSQIVSELGLIGLASLGWIFWVLVRGPYRSRELASTAWVLASVYLVAFLGEPFFHKQASLIAFGLVAGLLSGAQLNEMEEPVAD